MRALGAASPIAIVRTGCGPPQHTVLEGHVRRIRGSAHQPGGGRSPRPARPARRHRRRAGCLRRPARGDPRRGRPCGRGRRRRHPAHVPRGAAAERVPPRRAAPGPHPGAGAVRRPRGGGRPLPRAADPGGGGMSGADLTRKTAAELAALIHSREVSAVEVARAHLDRIAAVDGRVHAFLHVAEEAALEAATVVDESLAAGTPPASPLAGVPLALKDVFTTIDMPTTAGSRILEGWRPPYDATLTARLRAAGITILGKTNVDEFAMGSSTEYSAFGPTRNPWDLERVPGGSGGGSAAALAAFEAPLAIGTDTGGSIRQPAAFTGTVGAKPTYGGVSRYGLIACASSLDQGGPCARTVLDTALLHEVIAGHDPMDSTSIDQPVPPVAEAARRGADGDLSGLRIGVVRELSGEGYQPGVRASYEEALRRLEKLGAELVEVSCPHFEYGLAAYYLILPSEVS